MGVEHVSVMVREVCQVLCTFEEGLIVDGTVGPGGHAEAMLEVTKEGVRLLGMDLDPDALSRAALRLQRFGSRVKLVHRGYEELQEVLEEEGEEKPKAILLDLGMSSVQLASERGFSVQKEGPLDMRFDPTSGPTAAEIIRKMAEDELAHYLKEIGQVPRARMLAKALKAGPVKTMADFREACRKVLGPRIRDMDSAILPAMVLRILTNRELQRLQRFLASVDSILARGGALAIITYHSGEDRIVKNAFRTLAAKGAFRVPFPKGLKPSEEEVKANPRSRSARLRVLLGDGRAQVL